MKKSIPALLTIFFWLAGCSSVMRVEPITGTDQSTVFRDGTAAVVSKKRSVVIVRPISTTYRSTEKPTFDVAFLNQTEHPVNFSTENISASLSGVPVKVFTYDELVAEVDEAHRMAAVGAVMSGVGQSISASSAGNQYTYGNFNGNYYSSNGYSGSAYGTYSSQTYNPAAVQQAQAAANAQLSNNLERIQSSSNVAREAISSSILKKETVFPNLWHRGRVQLQKLRSPDGPSTIQIDVVVDGEQHQFTFLNTKVK